MRRFGQIRVGVSKKDGFERCTMESVFLVRRECRSVNRNCCLGIWNLVTDRTMCIVCSTGVLMMPQGHHGKEYSASPQLFSQDGPVKSCTLLWKQCTQCQAKHYFSYAVGGHLLPEGDMLPFSGWSDMRYCHISEHMVYETKLLKRYREQCLHSHSSTDAFSKEYDALARANGKQGLPHGVGAWAHGFRVIWRAFELVTWEQEIVEWELARAPGGRSRTRRRVRCGWWTGTSQTFPQPSTL